MPSDIFKLLIFPNMTKYITTHICYLVITYFLGE